MRMLISGGVVSPLVEGATVPTPPQVQMENPANVAVPDAQERVA
jgi:hypothetical protein